jgi:co-chaperonin GroES (HSP10)
MAMVKSATVVELSQADPKLAKAIYIQKVGDLSKEVVLYDLVLVATYFRPERTQGGIIRPDDNIREDEYQGKVGLVLKLGEDISQPRCEPGDWVVYSIKDGWAVTINGVPCRLVPHDRIRMKTTTPTLVF